MKDDLSPSLTGLVRRLAERSPRPGDSVAHQRAEFEDAVAGMPLHAGVEVRADDADGVPVEWLEPTESSDAVLLYLHGGGYVIGSCGTIRPLASQLAAASRAPLLTVDYRLAPENRFPAAVEDALHAYEWLLGRGVAPQRVAVGGDSAGGGLAVATLLAARDRGLPLPTAGVCLSPWVDLTLSGPSFDANAAADPQVQRWLLAEMAAHYLGPADARAPLASPVFADLSGLPPLLVHTGSKEALVDDGRRLVDAAKQAGTDATLRCWPGMIHVWHAFAPRLSEANDAIAEIGQWLRARWDERAGTHKEA
jgi:acetyl esterase/lipase